MVINENSSIKDLTNGKYSSLKYDAAGNNYTGPLVPAVIKMIDQTGCDVTNTQINTVGSTFRNIILNYQKQFNLPQTGVLTDDLLHDIYNRVYNNANNVIPSTDGFQNNTITTDPNDFSTYDAHYDPFFLNNSGKIHRKNHKDIIISLGNGSNIKRIKDVFMRSVSVQVDTSGNPISEMYSFIARDIKESDAPEDHNKYIGEEKNISSSSDIKYNFDNLYKEL